MLPVSEDSSTETEGAPSLLINKLNRLNLKGEPILFNLKRRKHGHTISRHAHPRHAWALQTRPPQTFIWISGNPPYGLGPPGDIEQKFAKDADVNLHQQVAAGVAAELTDNRVMEVGQRWEGWIPQTN